jgi:hypothetical protein
LGAVTAAYSRFKLLGSPTSELTGPFGRPVPADPDIWLKLLPPVVLRSRRRYVCPPPNPEISKVPATITLPRARSLRPHSDRQALLRLMMSTCPRVTSILREQEPVPQPTGTGKETGSAGSCLLLLIGRDLPPRSCTRTTHNRPRRLD